MLIRLATRVAELETLIDDDDWLVVLSHRWWFAEGYAVTRVRLVDGSLYTWYMHRMLMGVGRGDRRHVDHVNRDRLDNRRSNLEVTTQALNNQNVGSLPNSSSRYRGVVWYKNYGCWRAQAKVSGQFYHIGYFDLEEDAALAAAEWRAKNMPNSAEARAAH